MENLKQQFIEKLLSTGRDGMENTITHLERLGFFVDSVIIASLLHDVCKSNIYKDAILNRKNDQGYWEKVPGYEVDYSSLPLGHGEKSVIMLLTLGLKMTRDEMLAIRWHMTAWELAFQSPEQKSNLQMARDTAPLCAIIQAADGLSTALLEK